MDIIDWGSLCLLVCLAVSIPMAYMFHIISVLRGKIEHQEYKVTSIEDYLAIEATQQKLRLEALKAELLNTINADNSEIRKMILSFDESNKIRIKSIDDILAVLGKRLLSFQNKTITNGVNIETIQKHEMQTGSKITDMKTEIMKQIQDLKDTIIRFHSDQKGVKDDLAEIKENLTTTFRNIFKEFNEVYKVIEHMHERMNKLDVNENSQYETNIVTMIKSGLSRLRILELYLALVQNK